MAKDLRSLISYNFMKIGIVPIAADLARLNRALNSVKVRVPIAINDFTFRCAVDFRDLLIQNIVSQKFSGSYAPYNLRYARWKVEKAKAGSSFWLLGRDLIKSLSFFKVKDGWMAGIPPGATDTGGKSMYGGPGRSMLISVYGRWMEFGRRGQPPRPLFVPTTEEYSDTDWRRRAFASLDVIAKGWR